MLSVAHFSENYIFAKIYLKLKNHKTQKMKKLAFMFVVMSGMISMNAQTLEEMKAEQGEKKASIAKLQGEVDAIQGKINALPGWKMGAFGTVGGSLSGFNNWFSKGTPNSSSGNIGITVNGFANLIQDKYFWRNSANVNLSWIKLDDKDIDTDVADFQGATDVFGITSLFGYKLTEHLAVSTLGEYRSTFIDNFNNPGYLDIGLGGTWTPITDLVVVVHPLNYNFIFSDGESTYESSLGAKIVADYARKIGKVNFKTNLSTFQSYQGSDLSNWTWTNSFGYTLWKGIGLGFDFGLRGNKQEAFNYALAQDPPITPTPTLGDTSEELQSYWMFGLNYAF